MRMEGVALFIKDQFSNLIPYQRVLQISISRVYVWPNISTGLLLLVGMLWPRTASYTCGRVARVVPEGPLIGGGSAPGSPGQLRWSYMFLLDRLLIGN
jgi:hypothetical protein